MYIILLYRFLSEQSILEMPPHILLLYSPQTSTIDWLQETGMKLDEPSILPNSANSMFSVPCLIFWYP